MTPFIKSKLLISSAYGPRTHPITGENQFHNGIDIVANFQSIFAPKKGKVFYTGNGNLSGLYVGILHPDNIITEYSHCSQILVSPDDEVKEGQEIAISGNSGRTTGPHIHFCTKIPEKDTNGRFKHFDPTNYANKLWSTKTFFMISIPVVLLGAMYLIIRRF